MWAKLTTSRAHSHHSADENGDVDTLINIDEVGVERVEEKLRPIGEELAALDHTDSLTRSFLRVKGRVHV